MSSNEALQPKPSGTITYEIDRGWVRLARWCGYGLALFAIGYVVGYLYAPDEVSLGLAIVGAVFFGGLALVGLRLGHTPGVYSVEISDEGVRRTSTGAWIPWSGVTALRERPILNRVDLIGPGGPTGINLEYQLDAFQDALGHVLERVRLEPLHDRQSFRRSPAAKRLVVAVSVGVCALGAWLWTSQGGWLGPALILAMLAATGYDLSRQIAAVTLSSDSLTIRRGFRSTSHAVRDITSVQLALRPLGNGNQYLDVFIKTRGESIPIRPGGSDPFQLFTAVRSLHARAAGLESG